MPPDTLVRSLYQQSLPIIKEAFEVTLRSLSIPGRPRSTDDPNVGPTDNTGITVRSVPASQASLQDQSLRARAKHEFSLMAITLIGWIPPFCLILCTVLVVFILYKKRYVNGLLVGAFLSSGVYALVESNTSSPTSLRVAVLLGYLIFHATYCYTVKTLLGLGEVFLAVATLAAVVVLAILSLVSGLPAIWQESTGFAGIWSICPIHLIIFFLGAMTIKIVRGYVRHDREWNVGPLLPMTVQDVNDATSTSRGDEVLESRRRITADTEAVL